MSSLNPVKVNEEIREATENIIMPIRMDNFAI